jgi:hypothetical protein
MVKDRQVFVALSLLPFLIFRDCYDAPNGRRRYTWLLANCVQHQQIAQWPLLVLWLTLVCIGYIFAQTFVFSESLVALRDLFHRFDSENLCTEQAFPMNASATDLRLV